MVKITKKILLRIIFCTLTLLLVVLGRLFVEKPTTLLAAPSWSKTAEGWKYKEESGQFATKKFLQINGNSYYFNQKGLMVTGWKTISGKKYFFQKSGTKEGAMVKGWLKRGKKWYYLDKNSGVLQKSKWINGDYYVGSDGAMVYGWLKYNKNYYYLKSPNGNKAKSEWLKIDNKWYRFGEKGKRKTNSWIAGKYYVKSDGTMAVGWLTIAGNSYYFDSNGAKTTGWKKISGVMCYFDNKGIYDKNKKKVGYKIAIDAGHQKNQNKDTEPIGPGSSTMKQKVTSGTQGVSTGVSEYQINLTVALKLQKELERRGYDVFMIRTVHDVNISNAERAKMAAASGSDIMVRIHCNGDSDQSVYGALTMSPADDNEFLTTQLINSSKQLSQKVINAFCNATGAKNRGVLYTNSMSGINWCAIPVTIIELGFMSNPNEDKLLNNLSYQTKMVNGIADGIDKYFY